MDENLENSSAGSQYGEIMQSELYAGSLSNS